MFVLLFASVVGIFIRVIPTQPVFNSKENEVSLYIVTTCSKIQVMRIKKVINKDKMS